MADWLEAVLIITAAMAVCGLAFLLVMWLAPSARRRRRHRHRKERDKRRPRVDLFKPVSEDLDTI